MLSTMTRLTLSCFSVLALAACGGQSSQSSGAAAPANPCGGAAANPCGGGNATATAAGPAAPDFSNWTSWTQVNDQIFMSKGHKKKPANVFTPPQYADFYKNLSEGQKAPVGFQVAKAHYPDMTGASVAVVMVMAKMQAGYDPDNGDWFYGIYDPSGTKAMQSGKLEMCQDCHDTYDDQDYLAGLPK